MKIYLVLCYDKKNNSRVQTACSSKDDAQRIVCGLNRQALIRKLPYSYHRVTKKVRSSKRG